MRLVLKSLMLLLGAVLSGAATSPPPSSPRYAAGQIWEYRHRPQDVASLLKIRRVEDGGKLGVIYHITIVGLVLRNPAAGSALHHAPVSQQTLDASVTRLGQSAIAWPDVEPGIAQWRQDNGGVFTIPVAQIVQIIDDQTAAPPSPSVTS